MDALNGTIVWYQQRIGAYDKQLWEKSVESQVMQSLHNVPKKSTRVKAELIDVDLVRGSTFTKAKPQQGWLAVSRKGLLRVLFLPLCYGWWQKQTSWWFWLVLVLLYFLQMLSTIVYFTDKGNLINNESISLAHVLSPITTMIILGLLHAQIVATHISQKQRRSEPNSRTKITHVKKRRGKSKYGSMFTSDDTGAETNDPEEIKRSRSLPGFKPLSHLNCHANKKLIEKASCHSEGSTRPIHDESGDTELTSSQENGFISNQSSEGLANQTHRNSGSLRKRKSVTLMESSKGFLLDEDSTHQEGDGDMLEGNSHECLNELSNAMPESTGEILLPAELDILSESVATIDDNQDGVLVGMTNGNGESAREMYDDDKEIENLSAGKKHSSETLKRDEDKSKENSLNHLCESKNNLKTNKSSEDGKQKSQKCMTPGNKLKGKAALYNCSLSENDSSKANYLDRPGSLNMEILRTTRREVSGISSCESEGETTPNTPTSQKIPSKLRSRRVRSSSRNSDKGQTSEWEDTMNTGVSTTDTSECPGDQTDLSDNNDTSEDPFGWVHLQRTSSVINNIASTTDKVSCMIWENEEVKKVDLTVIDIGWSIIRKSESVPEQSDYLIMGLFLCFLLTVCPLVFRLYHAKVQLLSEVATINPGCINHVIDHSMRVLRVLFGDNWKVVLVVTNGIIQRFATSSIFFFILAVAERTFMHRLLHAKHFCYLTSSRRAKKYELPHFRLNKVRNIKTWLSLRSYLKKRGPQRSVDVIVSAAFILAVTLVAIMCIELLQDSGGFLDHLGNWELCVWCFALGVYLLRFMTLGTKINKKYRNFSVLITEQINLYLHMEQKPHKKDELMLANNVLKLAEDLLKELESPFKISGLSANPFLYNVTRVVILSAFSAVLTELLGFKLKLYKIKVKV